MSDVIKDAKRLAELKVPPLQAEITVHEDEDPRYTDDCLVQIIEKDDEYSIWYEEEHGGYEHGKLHFAHVFAAAPELAQALAEETWEYAVQFKNEESGKWYTNSFYSAGIHGQKWFASKDEAEQQIEKSYPADLVAPRGYRIVRRRVSPPEVINEWCCT